MSLLETVAPLFSSKLRQRQNEWRDTVRKAGLIVERQNAPVAWFHAASAGEFEQAKPVIEYLANSGVPLTIIASFFSPSGFEAHRTYPFINAAVYLPLDSFFSVRFFLRRLRPSVAVIIRYELWFELFRQIRNARIPLLLISATFPSRRLPACIFKEILRAVTTVYSANADSADKFRPLISSSAKLITAADTRFDRIFSIAREAGFSSKNLLPNDLFAPEDIVIVAGSSWPEDEELLAAVHRTNKFSSIRFIVVPHEVTQCHLDSAAKLFPNAIKLSELSSADKRCDIIADCYGKLLMLYCFADIAYIGGGFGAGVHSVAEPAGYGIPLICGPRIYRAPDAVELHRRGGLRVISDKNGLIESLDALISSKENRLATGAIARQYIESGTGTSRIIGEDILARVREAKTS
ncbi:MAG: hypothetical protein LC116_02850 [Bacteroidetes bacterium]|nr:hypothetical protein [Bacteroidota bacterium]